MFINKLFFSLIAVAMPLLTFADHCGGKIDFGPVFIHLDVLDSGHTVKKLDMGGAKLNGTIMLKEGTGFCVKPDILFASGHGELIAGSFGFGHVTPLFTEGLCLTPSIGVTLTNLRTSANFPTGFPAPHATVHLRERFRSLAPYIGIDINYNLCEGFRVGGNIQYSWSHTHTKIKSVGKFKGDSEGFAYAAMVEKDLNKHWSLHLGAAYNVSLSHEKHGLRGYGFKLGVARWF